MAKLTKNQKREQAKKRKQKAAKTYQHEQNRITNEKFKRPRISDLPEFIGCNNCDGIAPKSTYEILSTDDMKGINLAFSGICEKCDSLTVAMKGDPEACRAFHEAMLSSENDIKASIQNLKSNL